MFNVHGHFFQPAHTVCLDYNATRPFSVNHSDHFSIRSAVCLGYCEEAIFKSTGPKKRIEIICKGGQSINDTTNINVAAFDIFSTLFQHDMINAVPTYGLTIDVLNKIHSSASRTALTRTSSHIESLLAIPHVQIHVRPELRVKNFAMAFPIRAQTWDTYPYEAYAPFRAMDKQKHGDRVLLLSRTHSRRWADETTLVKRLREVFADKLVVTTKPQELTNWTTYSTVVGVHGGAFGNIYKLAPKTHVIEVVMESNHRWCYAAMAYGLDMRYTAIAAPGFKNIKTKQVRVDPSQVLNHIIQPP